MVINPLWAGAIAVTLITGVSAYLENKHRQKIRKSHQKFLKRMERRVEQQMNGDDPLIMSPGWQDRLGR